MCHKKTVSVVMCTFNGEKYLKEQLDSIIHQTYPVDEILIQDDCSEDGTIGLLDRYSKEYPNIVFSKNDVRLGVNKNFFSVLSKAKGDYIAIADQDDIWELNKIEEQLQAIGDNLLNFHLSEPFSSDGVPIAFDKRIPNYGIIRMIYFNMIPGHTMLLRRDLLNRIYDEQVFLYDALLAIAAGVCDKINYIDKVLVHHRRYMDAYSYHKPVTNGKSMKNIITYLYISLQHLSCNRKNVYAHFNSMDYLLNLYCSDELKCPDFNVALRFTELYKEQSPYSLLRASILCIKHRRKIFYAQENSSFIVFLRAMFHPILMYHYYE